jgi:leucyl/phenylalanyl-tRNA--protein transferase
MHLALLEADNPEFPAPHAALKEPDGLLAVGGNLYPSTLISAYSQGIFPWYQDGDPILWWSPSKRCVLPPAEFHISKSLRKQLKRHAYQITTDINFAGVVSACAESRGAEGTWISDSMAAAYVELHKLGYAHSVEVWDRTRLVGGIYGVTIGSVFCGESMFSAVSNGSKIAMAYLCQWLQAGGYSLVDCQIKNDHLISLGARDISRKAFLSLLETSRSTPLAWPQPAAIDWGGD